MDNMEYRIPHELLEKVFNYLATQPYANVAMLINSLQNIKPVEEKKEEEKIKPTESK